MCTTAESEYLTERKGKGDFLLSTDPGQLDLDFVHEFLTHSYWAKGIPRHPRVQGLRRWSLVTHDAHGLYEQFGFKPLAKPENYMELHDP